MRKAGMVLAGAMALVAVGCGRGDDGEDVTTVKEIDVLQEATAAGTFRASITAEETDDEDSDAPMVTTIEMTGVVDPAVGAFDLEGSFTATPVVPDGAVDDLDLVQASTVGLRSDGVTEWVRYGGEDAQWIDFGDDDDSDAPEDEEADDEDVVFERFLDPAAFLEQVREHATTFTEVGPEEVDGVATTHYRATVADEDLGTVEVWVDDQDRPRRLEAEGATMSFTDYEVPVDIAAPPSPGDEDDLLGAFTMFSPQVTGEWAELSSGTVDGVGWTVWQADAVQGDVATHCWTFEGEGSEGGVPYPLPEEAEELFAAFPNREGISATCPGGLFSGPPSSDPAVIVLDGGWTSELGATALRLSDRFADAPVVLVYDDGTEVEVPVDAAGIAVLEPVDDESFDDESFDDEGPELEEVRLDGGSVTCPAEGWADAVDRIGICVAA